MGCCSSAISLPSIFRTAGHTPGHFEGVSPRLNCATTPGSPMVVESPLGLTRYTCLKHCLVVFTSHLQLSSLQLCFFLLASSLVLFRSSTPGMYSRLSSQPIPSAYTPSNKSQLTYPSSSQIAYSPSPQYTPQPVNHQTDTQHTQPLSKRHFSTVEAP